MHNDWILDVLKDLREFAVANNLGVLAEQLDDTSLVAAAEIASHKKEADRRGNERNRQSESGLGRLGRLLRA